MMKQIFNVIFLLFLTSVMSFTVVFSVHANPLENIEDLFAVAKRDALSFVRCNDHNKAKPWLGCWKNGRVGGKIQGNMRRFITMYKDKTGNITSKRFGNVSFSWENAGSKLRLYNRGFKVNYRLEQGIYLVSDRGKYMVLVNPSAAPILEMYSKAERNKAKPATPTQPKPKPKAETPKPETKPEAKPETKSVTEPEQKMSQEQRDTELQENLRILDEALN